MDAQERAVHRIVGHIDTYKDLHVAAVVDEQDRCAGTPPNGGRLLVFRIFQFEYATLAHRPGSEAFDELLRIEVMSPVAA